LRRSQSFPEVRFLLFATALAFCAGCALFQDLDGSAYRLADAGSDAGACGADGACPTGSTACQSADNCSPGQVCCASLNPQTGATVSCVDGVAGCTSMGSLAVQLCHAATECGNGGPCMTQTCAFGGSTVSLEACSTVPFCEP
jgi:hypothetical protein